MNEVFLKLLMWITNISVPITELCITPSLTAIMGDTELLLPQIVSCCLENETARLEAVLLLYI